MQKLVFINGLGNEIDLTAGNFGITNWAGLSNTELNIQTQQVPFEDGGVFLDALMEQREIEVTVAIYDGNNLELRYQKKRELISALNPKLGEGTLIYTNDYLSRQIKAVPQLPVFENKNSNDAGTLKVSVAFSCPSPYWEDIDETVIELNKWEPKTIANNGDIPVSVKIDINSQNITNPIVINITQKKKIKVDTVQERNIYINTLIGSKEVYTQEAIYNFLSGFKPNDILEDNDKIIMVGNGIAVYDVYGGIASMTSEIELKRIKKLGNAYYTFGQGTTILTSENGISWSQLEIGGSINCQYIYDLELIGNRFLACGYAERGAIASWDIGGKNFYSTNELGYSGTSTILTKGNTFYMYGYGITTDGINFSAFPSSPTISPSRYNYRLGDGMYLGVMGSSIYKTEDCINWTNLYTDSNGGTFITISKQSGKYIALLDKGNETGAVIVSINMASWSSLGTFSITPLSVSYLASKYVVYNNKGETQIKYENEEWGMGEFLNSTFYAILYKNGKYYLGGYDNTLEKGVIKVTEDFNSWENVLEASEKINCLVFENGKYIAGSDNGTVYVSEDLITWDTIQTDSTKPIRQIDYDPTLNKYACVCMVDRNTGDILFGEDLSNLELKQNILADDSRIAHKNGLFYFAKYQTDDIYTTEDFETSNLFYTQTISNLHLTKIGIYNGNIFAIYERWGWQFGDSNIFYFENETPTISNRFEKKVNGYCIKNGVLYFVCDGGFAYWNEDEKEVAVVSISGSYMAINYDKDLIIAGTNNTLIGVSEKTQKTNLISSLSQDSDMNFGLVQGENTIEFGCDNGTATALFSFRQKYIGV